MTSLLHFKTIRLLLTSLTLASAMALADTPPAPARGAPVVVQNRTVIVFRAPLLGYTPQERAEGAAQRIEAALGQGRSGEVSVRKAEEGNLIQVGDAGLFLVTAADANTLAGETLESVTEQAIANLRRSLAEAHEQRDPRRLGIAALLALIATAIYSVVLRGIVIGERKLAALLGEKVQARAAMLRIAGVTPLHPAHVVGFVRTAVEVIAWLLAILVTYWWLTWLLEQFPYTRVWGEQLKDYFVSIASYVGQAMLGAIPGLVMVAVIVVITRFLMQIARVFFRRIETGQINVGWLDADTVRPTRRIVTAVLWLFALAMAYPYLPGAQTDAFKGVSVLVGLMISIGASSVIAQAASGLILVYSRALKVGEFVCIGDTEGTVAEVGMFATRIATGMGEAVVLPNAYVIANTTKNFSREAKAGGFVVQVQATIGYSTPWRQVHAMLIEAARRTAGVMHEPAPYVVQTSLSDFYIEYRLVCWATSTSASGRVGTISALNEHVQDVFNEHGVQIMSPHYMMDPAHPQVVPKENWFAPPARRAESAE